MKIVRPAGWPPVTVEFDPDEADFFAEYGAQSTSYTVRRLADLLKKEGYG